ncbi:MAG: GFA family protein [Deltaproteobacteria bacterium]|nr:GFA family protein [Deltaproteobacteria bacterium]
MTNYRGSCHCGDVHFEIEGALERASECNCSICSRVGWRMASLPKAQFRLLRGEDAQTNYQFGPKSMQHLFCRRCGVHAYGVWGSGADEKVIVNLRCLEDFPWASLPVDHFDGKSY